MVKIPKKTLQDLEFPTVLQQVSTRCNTALGKVRALEIKPISDTESLSDTLGRTSEYLSSFVNENREYHFGSAGVSKNLKPL